jgi:hypothetical protein
MGIERIVGLPHGEPAFGAVLAKLAESGKQAVVRMIDGMPAFPDETPAEDWREVRLSFPEGMITIRRQSHSWACVVWGSADNTLLATRDHLCACIATVGRGMVSAAE